MISISKHISAVLSANESVSDRVKDRIFPLAAVQECAYPFIVFERTSLNASYDKEGRVEAESYVSLYAVAQSYKESMELGEAIVAALDRLEATYPDFDVVDAIVTGASEDFVDQVFVQQIQMKFFTVDK